MALLGKGFIPKVQAHDPLGEVYDGPLWKWPFWDRPTIPYSEAAYANLFAELRRSTPLLSELLDKVRAHDGT